MNIQGVPSLESVGFLLCRGYASASPGDLLAMQTLNPSSDLLKLESAFKQDPQAICLRVVIWKTGFLLIKSKMKK